MLECKRKTLQICGLPNPQYNWYPLNSLIHRELAYNPWDEVIYEAEKSAKLNIDQRSCFQTILYRVNLNQSESLYFFLQDPAGIKKTFLYNILSHHY